MTVESPEACALEAGAEISMFTEKDYEKRLMLVPLKVEKVEPCCTEAEDQKNKIECGNLYPLHGCILMPVYNVEDKIIQILKVHPGNFPGSLRSELNQFYRHCDSLNACYYYLPFSISRKEHRYGADVDKDESGQGPLLKVSPGFWPWFYGEIAAREECVTRFLKEYRTGDLLRAAIAWEQAKRPNGRLKLANWAGYIRRVFSFFGFTEKVGQAA